MSRASSPSRSGRRSCRSPARTSWSSTAPTSGSTPPEVSELLAGDVPGPASPASSPFALPPGPDQARRVRHMPPVRQQQPSVSDQLAEDALPTAYREGAPELLPYLQLRRRSRRAQFKRKYAEVIAFQEELQKKHKGITPESPVAD